MDPRKESFRKVIEKAWSMPCSELRNIDVWQFRVRTFRRLVRGWASNQVALLNKSKVRLYQEHDDLDKISQHRNLSEIVS